MMRQIKAMLKQLAILLFMDLLEIQRLILFLEMLALVAGLKRRKTMLLTPH